MVKNSVLVRTSVRSLILCRVLSQSLFFNFGDRVCFFSILDPRYQIHQPNIMVKLISIFKILYVTYLFNFSLSKLHSLTSQ